tara:strand:+ start:627 stop:827 length:201 start_codon:yes stop_codon:yes gene_type:complete
MAKLYYKVEKATPKKVTVEYKKYDDRAEAGMWIVMKSYGDPEVDKNYCTYEPISFAEYVDKTGDYT